MTRWLRAHAVLLVVYGSALVLAALELANPDVRVGKLESPEAYLEPELNVADVSAELYPHRALTLYYQAYQASLCDGRARDPRTVCSRRGPPRPGEVRELIERSLATGNQSIELALYNYALVLLHENAPAAEVDAAVRRWRLAYPASSHPDPRVVYAEQRRGARGDAGDAAAPRFNAILISIDTLRADHVGAYGYPLPTTPHIDALANDGLRVATCIAHAPMTLASHASILTSLLPWHHGASVSRERRLADGVVTLAEVLAGHGYRTASFNGGIQLDAAYGLDRGFEVYESAKPVDARAQSLVGGEDRLRHGVERAVQWIGERRGPFFVFLHSYEIHHPYTPDPEFVKALGVEYAGDLPEHISVELLERINDGRQQVTREDVLHIAHAYDAELRSADDAIGRLVAWLREHGLYDDTLIAVTSDHGEEFGEHGRVGWHAHTLYDELLRVPLVIKLPRSRLAGMVDARQARSIDIAPTILAALQVDAPAGFAGRDLAAGAGGNGEPPPAVSLHDAPGEEPLWGIRTPRWKLKEVGTGSLHDLVADPGERENVIEASPRQAEDLRRAGLALLHERERREGAPAALAERTREQLRELGYVE